LIFGVAAIFLLAVSPLRPPRRPFCLIFARSAQRSVVDYNYVTQRCDVTEAIATRSVTAGKSAVITSRFSVVCHLGGHNSSDDLSRSRSKFNRRGVSARRPFLANFQPPKEPSFRTSDPTGCQGDGAAARREFYAPGT